MEVRQLKQMRLQRNGGFICDDRSFFFFLDANVALILGDNIDVDLSNETDGKWKILNVTPEKINNIK